MLTAEQGAALDQVAKQAQDAKDSRRTGRTREGIAQDARDITVFRAREALNSPYLVPGDRRVLQARVNYPTATAGELARRLRMSETAFTGKLYGALNRKLGSVRHPPAVLGAPRFTRKRAAEIIGVSLVEFDVMVRRGMFTHVTSKGQGAHRNYLRSEVHGARRKLEETVLALAEACKLHAMGPSVWGRAADGEQVRRWEVWYRPKGRLTDADGR